MKVERVSYDVITPSAARAVFDAIFWKPEIRWRIQRIEVLSPVRWTSVRRNEVGAIVSTRNAVSAMKLGKGQLGLYIEEERQQRAGLLLRDVAYRLFADMDLISSDSRGDPNKYVAMFVRRASTGQCINQPYLGCREFAARFRLVDASASDPLLNPVDLNADLGWMLYDMDFSSPGTPRPTFFRAVVRGGVIDLSSVEVRG